MRPSVTARLPVRPLRACAHSAPAAGLALDQLCQFSGGEVGQLNHESALNCLAPPIGAGLQCSGAEPGRVVHACLFPCQRLSPLTPGMDGVCHVAAEFPGSRHISTAAGEWGGPPTAPRSEVPTQDSSSCVWGRQLMPWPGAGTRLAAVAATVTTLLTLGLPPPCAGQARQKVPRLCGHRLPAALCCCLRLLWLPSPGSLVADCRRLPSRGCCARRVALHAARAGRDSAGQLAGAARWRRQQQRPAHYWRGGAHVSGDAIAQPCLRDAFQLLRARLQGL